jgi:hypothetical protein
LISISSTIVDGVGLLVGVALLAYACDVGEREGRHVVFGESKFNKKDDSFK